jgi:hypothetical protein
VFNNDLSLEIQGFELCLEEYSLEVEFMGINFGILAYAVVIIGGMAVVWGALKNNG